MVGTDRVEIRTLKVGRFCVVDDEAYKILSISKSKPGKHGSAKARLELVSLFSSKKISHVGIYIGNLKFIHAPNRKDKVKKSEITKFWKYRFAGFVDLNFILM